MTTPRIDLVQRYLSALEAFTHGDALAPFFTDDVTFRELPNRLVPEGRVRDRRALLEASAMAPKVLTEQRYHLRRALEVGDTLALDVDWSATLRVPVGNTPVGGAVRARLTAASPSRRTSTATSRSDQRAQGLEEGGVVGWRSERARGQRAPHRGGRAFTSPAGRRCCAPCTNVGHVP